MLDPELSARLGRYAEAWSSEYTMACTGTAAIDQTSPTLRCLQERRQEFEALLDVVSDPDAEGPKVAAGVADRLRPPSRCGHTNAGSAAHWVPEDPESRALAHRLRKQAAYAEGLSYAGRKTEAADALLRVRDAANDAGFTAITVQVETQRGGVLVTAGQPRQGRDVLADAYEVAVAGDFAYDATTIATDLVFAVGYTLGDADAGRRWARHAQAGLDRLGLDGEAQARLDSHRGSMEALAGRYAEAERFHRRAAAVRQRDAKDNPARLASTINNLGNAVLRQSRLDEALRLHREALALRERAFGRFHAHVAISLNNIATIHLLRGHWERAEAQLLDALKVWEATSGPDHRDLMHPLSNLATIASNRGRPRQAEAYARRGLAVAMSNDGADAPGVGTMHLTLGKTLGHQGRNDEALESLFAALRITTAAFGDEHEDVALIEHALGGRYRAMNKLDDAHEHLLRALAHWQGPTHVPSPHRASTVLRLSLVELEQGKATSVRQRLEALEADGGLEQLRPGDRAACEFTLAQAIVALDDDRQLARRHARAALATLDPRQHDSAALEAEIRGWLDRNADASR